MTPYLPEILGQTDGAKKHKTAVLSQILHFTWRNYAIKFLCVHTFSNYG